MFISIRTYDGITDMNELIQRGKAGLTPLIRAQPGFHAYYFADCGNGSGRSVSCFDTKEHAVAAYEAIRAWLQDNLSHLVKSPPTISGGINRQDFAIPTQVPEDAWVSFSTTKVPDPPSAATQQQARETILHEVVNDPKMMGLYIFRDEGDITNMAGAAFMASEADAKRLNARTWELMQERMPQTYPNAPVFTLGKLAVVIQ